MDDCRLDLSLYRPKDWFVVFSADCGYRLFRLLAAGRFNHVRCFGWVEAAGVWVFFEPSAAEAGVWAIPDHASENAIANFIAGATVVNLPARPCGGARFRSAFCCTTQVAHVTGVPSCALRPDRFFRDCLAAGGKIVSRERDAKDQGTAARPGPHRPAEGG